MWDVTITPSLDPASLIGLVHAPTISGWAMALIPFVTTHPNDTILSAFGSPYQTSQEVTNLGITLVEARLTAEF
jgi:cystathionine beta-lyase family protein involved in aluminum resistance